jgi:3-isopropylmalate dehydrogenase
MILSVGMMLQYSFKRLKEAESIEKAVEKVLNAGLRTADLAKKGEKVISCQEMGNAVVKEIK